MLTIVMKVSDAACLTRQDPRSTPTGYEFACLRSRTNRVVYVSMTEAEEAGIRPHVSREAFRRVLLDYAPSALRRHIPEPGREVRMSVDREAYAQFIRTCRGRSDGSIGQHIRRAILRPA